MVINFLVEKTSGSVQAFIESVTDGFIREHWRMVYSSVRLFRLSGLLIEVDDFLEVILRTLCGGILLIERLEKKVVIVIQIIRTATTVLYGGRKADIRRRLREGEGI